MSLVYRNPPWSAGPQVLMANELADIIDWGQLAQGVDKIWPLGTGKGILVGVCDTGRPVHSDLVNKIKFAQNFSSSFSDVDQQGHSTHVCGTVAAEKNGKGVVGVAHDAELCIAKVLGDDGSGDNIGVARGIRYCLDRGCDIISMSLGGGYDQEIEAAVRDAVSAGKFVICAAGNEGSVAGQNTVNWPARLADTVAVASYNRQGSISGFSSRGKEVDIACPGEDILSCWLGNAYRRLSGTSMAAPFLSGLVAIMISHQREIERSGSIPAFPIRDNATLLAKLKSVAKDKGPPGLDDAWGWGVVDTEKFVAVEVSKPSPPTTTLPPTKVEPVEETQLLGGLIRILQPVTYDNKKGMFIYIP